MGHSRRPRSTPTTNLCRTQCLANSVVRTLASSASKASSSLTGCCFLWYAMSNSFGDLSLRHLRVVHFDERLFFIGRLFVQALALVWLAATVMDYPLGLRVKLEWLHTGMS